MDAVVSEVNLVDAAAAGASLAIRSCSPAGCLKSGRALAASAVCATVSLARQEANHGHDVFADGTLLLLRRWPKLGDRTPYAVAITWRLGCYEGAEGEVHVTRFSSTM